MKKLIYISAIGIVLFLTACFGDSHEEDVNALQEEAQAKGQTLSEHIEESEEKCNLLLRTSASDNFLQTEINASNIFEKLRSSSEKTGGYIICKYLEAGGNPNIQDFIGTPLIIHTSAIRGYIDATQLLIDQNADTNAVDADSKNALYYVAQRVGLDRTKRMRRELDQPVLLNSTVSATLMQVISENTDDPSSTFFARAHKLIPMLAQAGSSLNLRESNYGMHTLHWIIFIDDIEEHINAVLQPLLQSENPNVQTNKGNTALHLVIYMYRKTHSWGQSQRTVQSTEEFPLPAYDNNNTGDIVIANLLETPNINVNIRNEEGKTPLFLAVETGNIDLVTTLLEAGADPNIKAKGGLQFMTGDGEGFLGDSPLDIAEDLDLTAIKDLLLEYINKRTGNPSQTETQ